MRGKRLGAVYLKPSFPHQDTVLHGGDIGWGHETIFSSRAKEGKIFMLGFRIGMLYHQEESVVRTFGKSVGNSESIQNRENDLLTIAIDLFHAHRERKDAVGMVASDDSFEADAYILVFRVNCTQQRIKKDGFPVSDRIVGMLRK